MAALSISSPDGIHPHSKYLACHDLRTRADQAAERGAVAVFFYNDDPTAEDPPCASRTRSTPGRSPPSS